MDFNNDPHVTRFSFVSSGKNNEQTGTLSFHNKDWYKNDTRLTFDIFCLGKSASRVIDVRIEFDNKEETLAGNFYEYMNIQVGTHSH